MGKKGTTYLKEDSKYRNGNPKYHLHIVISDPDIDGNVMVVKVVTFKGNKREDLSCILNINDHPFIKKKSYIRYDLSYEIEQIKLLQFRHKGLIILKEDIDIDVLKRIQSGAKKTGALPVKFRKYFKHF